MRLFWHRFRHSCADRPSSQSCLWGAKPTNQDWRRTITDQAPERILRLKPVLARTGLTRSTLYRKMDQGSFPRNIKLSERCVGWRESAVADWMRNPIFYSVDDAQI